MFSGKTRELLRRVDAARRAGDVVRVFAPAGDARSGRGRVRTHDGLAEEATPIDHPGEVLTTAEKSIKVVAVDEAHFLGQGLVAPVRALLARGVRVILAGVERDHRGDPFAPFPALLCEADEVLKLSGPCAVCGGPAVHSQRLTADDSPIVAGGAGMYEARCRRCFVAPPRPRG